MDAPNNEIGHMKRDSEAQVSSPRGTAGGALILKIVVLAGLAAGIVQALPFCGMFLTGTFWLAFSIYLRVSA